jgi:hypothetical protein
VNVEIPQLKVWIGLRTFDLPTYTKQCFNQLFILLSGRQTLCVSQTDSNFDKHFVPTTDILRTIYVNTMNEMTLFEMG